MATSTATSVSDYLASLPEDKRAEIAKVRAVVRKHLPKGYVEGMGYGMIYYMVPKSRLTETYNGNPLCYVGLGAHKNHNALYLMGAYGDGTNATKLKDGFASEGKKLDMGKSCIRFKKANDLALKAIGESIASIPMEDYVAIYEQSRLLTKAGQKKAAKVSATKTTSAKKSSASRKK